MKSEIRKIVGKEITGVIVANRGSSPRQQLFLTFADGTYYEIWGDQFSCAGGVDRGGAKAAAAYARSLGAEITAAYGDAADQVGPMS